MLLITKSFALLAVVLCAESYAGEVTFKDVTLQGYEYGELKFTKGIISSESLQGEIPEDAIYNELRISNASIPILYENCVAGLEGLTDLWLTEDGIEAIRPGAFKNISSHLRIGLSNNKLQEIVKGVFDGLPVTYITLTNNKLARIESGAFSNMPNLETISLDQNKLAYWDPNWFGNVPRLSTVSIRDNEIDSLPPNALKNFEREFAIFFANNKIKSLEPGVFRGAPRAYQLDFSYNEISSVDEELFASIRIYHLLLNNNQITCLPGDLSKILKANMINLYSNPWNCSCLEEVLEWADKNHRRVSLQPSDNGCNLNKITSDSAQDENLDQ